MAERVDGGIAVVGLGIMGACALWRLAARGARVVGFEQFAPGHNQGSSHGEARIIRSAYFEDPRYVPLVGHSFRLWDQLQAESASELLIRTGALMIGAPESVVIRGTLESAQTHNLPHEVLDAAALRARYPQHRLDRGEIAIYEEAAGVLKPEAAVLTAVSRAEQLGAQVRRHTVVERLEATPDGVRLYVDGIEHTFHRVVVAVGPWLGEFLPQIGVPLRVERQVQVWFPVRDQALYQPALCPVYIHQFPSGRNYYGFPSLDGELVKVGIHHEGAITTPNTVDRTVHNSDLVPLQRLVGHYLVGLDPVAARSSVCMYTNTLDENFVVGPAPNVPNVTLMGGFSGHGFKFGAVLGDAVADLVLTGKTDYPIDLFAPDRFS